VFEWAYLRTLSNLVTYRYEPAVPTCATLAFWIERASTRDVGCETLHQCSNQVYIHC